MKYNTEFSYQLSDEIVIHEFISTLQENISLTRVSEIIKAGEDGTKVNGGGIIYSRYSPEKNCFVPTDNCKLLVIRLSLTLNNDKAVSNTTNNLIKEYISKVVSELSYKTP